MTESPNNRSPMVVAAQWGSRITTIALEMALPPALGYWADQRLKTGVLFVALGGVLGLVAGMWHLIRITTPPKREPRTRGPESTSPEDRPSTDGRSGPQE